MKTVKITFLLAMLIVGSIAIFAAGDAIKVGDTIYAEVGSEQTTIRELDDNNKIQFKVGKNSYILKAYSVKPANIKFTLEQTKEEIVAEISKKTEFPLPDGSTLFLKYLEYGQTKSKLDIWIQAAPGLELEEEKEEPVTETATEEEIPETENETLKETIVEKPKTTKFKFNTKWLAIISLIAFLVIIGLIIYYNIKESHLIE